MPTMILEALGKTADSWTKIMQTKIIPQREWNHFRGVFSPVIAKKSYLQANNLRTSSGQCNMKQAVVNHKV